MITSCCGHAGCNTTLATEKVGFLSRNSVQIMEEDFLSWEKCGLDASTSVLSVCDSFYLLNFIFFGRVFPVSLKNRMDYVQLFN